jgi:ferric enterobactin receptor
VMEGVVVTSKTKLIENKIDKMVFNAEKDLTSQSGVATDVLKKIPQVSVDADGNVQLSGNSGIRFLINGKPSSAFGSNIADVLQSIPASQIKSVEVITSPGAKYDAQGLGGIINIILKNNNTRGYNGNLSLTAGTRMENGSFNFNARNTNFGVNAFFSGNKRLKARTRNTNNRVTKDSTVTSILEQESNSRFGRQGFQTGVGFDWTLDKFNSLSGNISYNDFEFNGGGHMDQSLVADVAGSSPAALSFTNSTNLFRFYNIDGSLNYKKTFKKEDQELEVRLSSSTGKNRSRSSSDQFMIPDDSLFFGTRSLNPANIRETELVIDYSQPIKKNINLGVGTKASFYNIESIADVNSYQSLSATYLPNDFLSNNLDYKQKVYAAYAELSFPVGKLFETKLGERYERTEINSYYSNALQQVKIPGYNTFVPSIFLSRKLGEHATLKLSYSKRIQRPNYEDLNPFINTNDPKNLYTGNPYLKPELGQRYEIGLSRELGSLGSMMINLFYRSNDRDIQPYVTYYPIFMVGDSTYTNVAVSSRENIGRENNAGMNLFGDMHVTPKLTIRGNLFLFHRHIINAIDPGYNSNSFNYRFNINATYQFTNTILAEFFGNFNAARQEAQGRYPSFTSYTMALRRQFWKKKGSLALTANNVFSEYLNQKTVLFGKNFTVNGERKIPFRSIGLNFTWKFGKLEFKKPSEENDSNLNPPAAQ